MSERSLHWQQVQCHGDVPAGRVGETVTAVEETKALYMYGGLSESASDRPAQYLDDLYEFDPEAANWRRKVLVDSAAPGHQQQQEGGGRVRHARAFHSTVSHAGRLYIFGGCTTDEKLNDVVCVSPSTGDRTEIVLQSDSIIPAPRYCHTAVVFGDAMWVFGGKCGSRNSGERLSDVYCFNFATRTWSVAPQHGDLPPPLSAHSAVVCGRRMYVFGGRSGDECCGDMYEFHFDTALWRRVPSMMQVSRARHSAVVHNGLIAVFGGWNGRRRLNDLYLHAVDGDLPRHFTDADQLGGPRTQLVPSKRECHAAVMWRNTMLVFSGRHNAVDDVQALRLGAPTLLELCRDWLALHAVSLGPQTLPERLYQRVVAWRAIHASPATQSHDPTTTD